MVETRLRAALGLLAIAAGISGTARAGVVVHADSASFQAATAGLAMSTIEFEGIAPERGTENYGPGGSLALSGVAFSTTPNATLSVVNALYRDGWESPGVPYYYSLGSGAYLEVDGGPPASLSIALPAGTLAAGFLLGTFDDASSGVTIALSTGESFVFGAPYRSAPFVGFVSSAPIDWITLTTTAGNYRAMVAVDSFAFGAAAPTPAVPEPNALAMLTLGAAALAVLARRRAFMPRE